MLVSKTSLSSASAYHSLAIVVALRWVRLMEFLLVLSPVPCMSCLPFLLTIQMPSHALLMQHSIYLAGMVTLKGHIRRQFHISFFTWYAPVRASRGPNVSTSPTHFRSFVRSSTVRASEAFFPWPSSSLGT